MMREQLCDRERRVVEQAHAADISCLQFSYELSIIATAAVDATVRLWDYQVWFHCPFTALLHSCITAFSL